MMAFSYASVCSGIEAPSVAWHALGWQPEFFSEIEKFPSAVLAERWPVVPNLGDFTKIDGGEYRGRVSLLVGGTPCQSFSVAGKRGGLDDPRGHLAIEFLALARRLRAKWVVWENVPGVLSSDEGRDFGAFLGALAECGYGFSYRVLDAQYFGVPQRRRRVFLVGYLGDWRPAAAVLLERQSLLRNPPPGREEGAGVAERPAACLNSGGNSGGFRTEPGEHLVFQAHGSNVGPMGTLCKASGSIPFTFQPNQDPNLAEDISVPVTSSHGGAPAIFDTTQITSDQNYSNPMPGDPCHPLAAGAHTPAMCVSGAVRRLTPRECERLQGFPDDYTCIPWGKKAAEDCPDSPRYRALGNSMAVPVMDWIGRRIEAVEELLS